MNTDATFIINCWHHSHWLFVFYLKESCLVIGLKTEKAKLRKTESFAMFINVTLNVNESLK